MNTQFISDIHLSESRPEVTRAFFNFLKTQLADTEALYILGDFFDAWIGDDDDSAFVKEVENELKKLSDAGKKIFLMHGNRDFLMGESFANRIGGKLIAENSVINLYGTPTILLHGDSLCTGDQAYQQFRQQVRSSQWQQQVLSQPLAARRLLAAQFSAKSKEMNSLKAEDIMDVTPSEVIRLMEEKKVKQMIHGHTHRPARHALVVDGNTAERIVLGDWHTQGWSLIVDATKTELINWAI